MKALLSCYFLMSVFALGQSFVEGFNKQFLEKKPKIGEMLSDAQGYDLDGQPFALSQLKGKFTVVVSGCFT